ncbi:MAG: hypothetical protein WD037_12825 [Balneolales bacterium]
MKNVAFFEGDLVVDGPIAFDSGFRVLTVVLHWLHLRAATGGTAGGRKTGLVQARRLYRR